MAGRERSTPMTAERTKNYTDAVFAIAATLLVLDLTATGFGDVQSNDDLWAALLQLGPNMFGFALSFVLLSGLWMVHLRQFRDIVAVDTTLLWLNNLRLLFIVLVPFSTSITAEYDRFLPGRVMLPLNFFLAALAAHLSWLWATRRGGMLLAQDRSIDARGQTIGGWAAVACGAIAAAASPWFGSLAFAAYLMNPPMNALLVRGRRRQGRVEGRG